MGYSLSVPFRTDHVTHSLLAGGCGDAVDGRWDHLSTCPALSMRVRASVGVPSAACWGDVAYALMMSTSSILWFWSTIL